jgi:type I restriction enzyme S subunit
VKIKILIPKLEEQNAIAEILTIADKEIEVLEKKFSILRNQKKYLLNNLITGKIRIKE